MILSQSCEYAVRAVLFIARKEKAHYVSINEISGELDISFHFLTKILQKLTRNNILKSYRGPNGGVRLAKAATELTIMDIISTIDGTKLFTNCVLGLAECNDANPCPFHDSWIRHRRELAAEFNNMTIQSLSDQVSKHRLRISINVN